MDPMRRSAVSRVASTSILEIRAGEVVVRFTSSPNASVHVKAVLIRQPTLASVMAAAPTGPLTDAQARRATRGQALPPFLSLLAM